LINVAGTKLVDVTVVSLWNAIPMAFSHWFSPMGLRRLQRKSALNRGAPVSVEFVNRTHWSNAAWPV
jgi:hypothetical protein